MYMADATARKRKQTEPAGMTIVAAGRTSAPAKRYQPPESFKHIKDKPLVPPEILEDGNTEVWLVQLPPQLDPASLNGVTWKVRTHAADGDLGHLQSSQGDSYSAVSEPSLAKQLYVVSPSPEDSQRSVVRGCSRHVSFVKRRPRAQADVAQPSTPAGHMDKANGQQTGPGKEAVTEASTKKKKKRKKAEGMET